MTGWGQKEEQSGSREATPPGAPLLLTPAREAPLPWSVRSAAGGGGRAPTWLAVSTDGALRPVATVAPTPTAVAPLRFGLFLWPRERQTPSGGGERGPSACPQHSLRTRSRAATATTPLLRQHAPPAPPADGPPPLARPASCSSMSRGHGKLLPRDQQFHQALFLPIPLPSLRQKRPTLQPRSGEKRPQAQLLVLPPSRLSVQARHPQPHPRQEGKRCYPLGCSTDPGLGCCLPSTGGPPGSPPGWQQLHSSLRIVNSVSPK